MLKICNICNIEKDFSEFYKKTRLQLYPSSSAGIASACKTCVLKDRAKYLKANPKAKAQADRKQHLKTYGLTPEGYNNLFIEQKGCCAGCGVHQSEFNRNFSVDHDHKTGKVRGLMCTACNLCIGYAQESKAILLNLIKYLDEHKPELADHNTNVVELRLTKKVG